MERTKSSAKKIWMWRASASDSAKATAQTAPSPFGSARGESVLVVGSPETV
jgi:hypothetical protein